MAAQVAAPDGAAPGEQEVEPENEYVPAGQKEQEVAPKEDGIPFA